MRESVKPLQFIETDKLLGSDYIPFFGGRPKRESIISIEDITNIKIDLWSTPSVSKFLKRQR